MPQAHKIAWDYDKRLSLVILSDDFQLGMQDFNDVFLSIYQEISARDIRNALSAQKSERRTQKQKAWRDFHAVVLTPEENERRDARRNLIRKHIALLRRPNPARPSRSDGPISQQVPAPLSRQTPIAVLFAENQDSRMTSRKRQLSYDDEVHIAPKRQRLRSQHDEHNHPHVQVHIRRRPLPSAISCQTLKNSPNKRAPRGATTTFQQTTGLTVRISSKNLEKTYGNLDPIPDAQAHPVRTRTGLFFRYTDADVEPFDSKAGFVARRYRGRVKMYQEPPATLDWTDVFHHVDPTGKTIGYDSPYVSVSDVFWWTYRLALKEMERGVSNGQISVVDAAALDPRGVYHLLPYHRQLKKKHEFTRGAWNYAGTHEYLCWKEIPAHAIISTFSVRELFERVTATPYMSRTLRLDVLSSSGGFFKSILPAFRRDNIQITPDVISTVAKLAHFMGLNAFSKAEHLAHLWTDVTQGWGVRLNHKTPEEWIQLAARFARALADSGDYILCSSDSRRLEGAFLEGLHWSCGSHHIRYDDSRIRRKNSQARLIGLADPAGLLSEDGVPSRSVRERLQSYQHPSADRTKTTTSSQVEAATRSLRQAIGIELAADSGSESDESDDEIQFEY